MEFRGELDAQDGTERSLLTVALGCLSNLESTVIRLHHESGLSPAQVAKLLGLDLGSVRAARARGLVNFALACKIDPAES